MRVLITDHDFADLSAERAVFGPAGVELAVADLRDPDAVAARAIGFDGLLVQFAPVTAAVVDRLDRCRVIARYGVGVDTIDVPAATRRGIIVCNVPTYCTTEVADHAIALLLALARRVVALEAEVRQGTWDVYHSSRGIARLGGRTLGLIGFGRIGQAVARRARAFDLRVLAYDPYVEEAAVQRAGAEPAALDELLGRADFVSLHAPLTAETHHLIGARELGLLRPTAYVVNTARGPLVDGVALAEALRAGRLAGAALDVTEQEPLPASSPLRTAPNLILTPHAAFYSQQAYADLHRLAAEAVLDVLQGRQPAAVVNPEVLPGPRE